MSYPITVVTDNLKERLIAEELNYDKNVLDDFLQHNLSSLTREQRHAYDTILDYIYSNKGVFFFVYGYGGTDKTFIWNTLSTSIRSRGDIVLNDASSGIASLLLPGGRNAHSRFKISLCITENSTCDIKKGNPHAELLKKAKLIIWDEAPMMNKCCFEALDKCLKDVLRSSPSYNKHMPFGGKVVVLGGDFRQILHVVPRVSKFDIVNATINSSYLWPFCKVICLTKNMRLLNGSLGSNASYVSEFSQWLLNIGDGKIGEHTDCESEIQIPSEMLIKNSSTEFYDLINFVYPDLINNMSNAYYFKKRTILAPTVELVGKVNDHIMSQIPGEEKIYLSSDLICKEDGNVESELDTFSPEVLNAINCSGLPLHKLCLKVEVPIMLMRNIDQVNGLCNGTRLKVRKWGNNVLECTILTGTNIEDSVLIPRMSMITDNLNLPFKFKRRQFSVSICFGMTINKSQGQTLLVVGLYLSRPVFNHGQLYVALSRVKSKQGLMILIENSVDLLPNKTINVVYKEVFENLI